MTFYLQDKELPEYLQLGFNTGNPWVGFSHTIPVADTTHTQTVNHTVSYETHGICLTCSILIIKVTTIITIVIVFNGWEGGDTMRWLLLLVPACTHQVKVK